jgi:octaprenyl-diphosphate synthase
MDTLKQRPTLNVLCAPIDGELKTFSECLERELSSQDELIRGIHNHLLKMTGKFLRPVLAILCSRVEGKNPPEVIRLSVAIELIHTATLVHDDIIDDSEWRRNQPSVYSKWGREISIVSGDYLYAKAFLILAGLENPRINQAFAACAHFMCEGEMKQIEKRNQFLMKETDYLKIIHQKTAALFQAACMGGAYFSGTSPENIEKLGRYGYGLGMAFQIVDDCLDLVGETETLGKTAGLDLNKSEVTLPLLYLFAELSDADRQDLTAQMSLNEPALREKVRSMADEKGAVARAMQKARDYVDKSMEELGPLPDSPFKDSLRHLGDYCLERVR